MSLAGSSDLANVSITTDESPERRKMLKISPGKAEIQSVSNSLKVISWFSNRKPETRDNDDNYRRIRSSSVVPQPTAHRSGCLTMRRPGLSGGSRMFFVPLS